MAQIVMESLSKIQIIDHFIFILRLNERFVVPLHKHFVLIKKELHQFEIMTVTLSAKLITT